MKIIFLFLVIVFFGFIGALALYNLLIEKSSQDDDWGI